jgi:hypothetical protein
MAITKRSFMLAAAILGVGLPSYGSLLINGSFESGTFVPDPLYPGDDTMNLTVGATDMTGWTTKIADLAWIGPSNPFGLIASDGGYFLDLSGFHDNAPYGGVQQIVATTIGTQYRLSLDIGTDPLYDFAAVSVQVTGGVGPTTFTSTPLTPNRWESFTFDFTASSASTTIELDGQAAVDEKYIGLDNVSLTVIPEPGVLTLIAGPGLLVFAAWRRLRKA